MSSQSSQQFESYVPVYDAIPDKWEDAKSFLVEHLKKISNAVNLRTIGWLLDEELLSGQAFIPGVTIPGNNPGNFRQVLRKVVQLGALVAGVNPGVNHGITFDANFKLIDLWISGTDTPSLTARCISGDNVLMTVTQFIVTSPQVFSDATAFCEYIQEL